MMIKTQKNDREFQLKETSKVVNKKIAHVIWHLKPVAPMLFQNNAQQDSHNDNTMFESFILGQGGGWHLQISYL